MPRSPAAKRERSEERFLGALRDFGIANAAGWLHPPQSGMTQKEIGAHTDLSRQLISSLLQRFRPVLSGATAPSTREDGGGGAPPASEWRIDPALGLIGIISIGPESGGQRQIEVAVSDLNAQLLPGRRRLDVLAGAPEEAWERGGEGLEELLSSEELRRSLPPPEEGRLFAELFAIAVILPGPVVSGEIPREQGAFWSEAAVTEAFRERFSRGGAGSVEVLAVGDVGCAAVADHRWRVPSPPGPTIYSLLQDRTVRLALLVEGDLFTGAGGLAGGLINSRLRSHRAADVPTEVAEILAPAVALMNPSLLVIDGDVDRMVVDGGMLREELYALVNSLTLASCKIASGSKPVDSILRGAAVLALEGHLTDFLRRVARERASPLAPPYGSGISDTQSGSGSAMIVASIAWREFNDGKLSTAREHFMAALDRAETLNEVGVKATSHQGIGSICLREGDLSGATDAFEDELREAQQLRGFERASALAWANRGLAMVALRRGHPEDAMHRCRHGLEIAGEHAERLWFPLSALLATEGDIHMEAGDPHAAVASYERSVGELSSLERRAPQLAWRQIKLGLALVEIGGAGRARSTFIAALEVAEAFKDYRACAQALVLASCIKDPGPPDVNAAKVVERAQTLLQHRQCDSSRGGLDDLLEAVEDSLAAVGPESARSSHRVVDADYLTILRERLASIEGPVAAWEEIRAHLDGVQSEADPSNGKET